MADATIQHHRRALPRALYWAAGAVYGVQCRQLARQYG